jgi:hypothetical protein
VPGVLRPAEAGLRVVPEGGGGEGVPQFRLGGDVVPDIIGLEEFDRLFTQFESRARCGRQPLVEPIGGDSCPYGGGMSLSHLVLSSGRSIDLTELRMSSTYRGMLEGYPCKPVNDMKIRGLQRQAERAFPSMPVHLVPPTRDYPDQSAGAFGPVEVLPSVACVGVFHSTPVAPELDPVLYRSALSVVWFQTVLDVPSGEEADVALRSIRWEELAEDYEL